MEIKSSLPAQRCPYCNVVLVNGVCPTEGCKLNNANTAIGYVIPSKQEEYPIIEI